jgi:Ca2+-binding EF-hand superfamily protein
LGKKSGLLIEIFRSSPSVGASGPAKVDPEMEALMKKIEEGKASPEEMFNAIDKDGSGSISKEEYSILAKRLGMNLSDHRVNEIFASLKQEGKDSEELDAK